MESWTGIKTMAKSANPISARDGDNDNERLVSRVAAVTVAFWVWKIVTTTGGDLCGDLLSITLGLGYLGALAVSLAAWAAVLVAKFRLSRFQSVGFWAAMWLSATAGAEISDTLGRGLGWGDVGACGALLLIMLSILTIWYAMPDGVAVDRVTRGRDELFYWATALAANSLGSVLGDTLGDRLGLDLPARLGVAALFLALMWGLYRWVPPRGRVFPFWAAFVVSRLWV